jgi:hypothetical protein
MLRADDTNVLVLEMKKYAKTKEFKADAELGEQEFEEYLDRMEELNREKGIPNLVAPVARELGRISQYISEDGGKKGVNLTLISGRPFEDGRSTIFFYRTHFGQAGNLLSRILEKRSQKSTGEIIIQTDCASANNIEKSVQRYLKIIQAGCYFHARRPFAKYCEQDEDLCYYLLRAFALIAANEERAFRGPITRERILHYRRHEKMIWKIIKKVCETIVEGEMHQYAGNKIWKKGSGLYGGCQYIITHYKKLVYYIDHPELFSENICIERNLRPEKMIEDAAKFRFSESGRVALDITRTMIATCRSAEVDFKNFLEHIFHVDPQDVLKHPERYTPFRYGQDERMRAPPFSCLQVDLANNVHECSA